MRVPRFASNTRQRERFGPGASPPMQPYLGHSALKLCEIGESRHHVGR